MAGPRYPNYFPELKKHSAFNKAKCKRYFPYLEAKAKLTLRNTELAETRETRNCTETGTQENPFESRINRTNSTPDLVVLALDAGILLSSVFPDSVFS